MLGLMHIYAPRALIRGTDLWPATAHPSDTGAIMSNMLSSTLVNTRALGEKGELGHINYSGAN